MNSFIETLNQWGGNFLGFAWPMLWQSSLLIAALSAFDLLARRKLRASIRYALWLVVLVKLCVPPTLALPTGPAWWLHQAPPPVVAKPPVHYTVTYDSTPLPEVPQTPLPAFIPPKPELNLTTWLLVVSMAVSLALLGWLLARWWQITRQVRCAETSERLAALVGEAQKIIGTKFVVQAKLTTSAMSPAVCGLFRPAVLIPQSLAENFSDEQLRAVLLHELIHLQRRDVWVNFLQALVQIFYWWHPLVWLANSRIRRVREEAVDDAVMLALRDGADDYAPTLLEVAKLALDRPLVSLGLVGIMESRHALRQRIERLVDFRAPRHAGLTLVSVLGILAFTAVAVPMGEAPVVEHPDNGTQVLTDPTNPVMASGRGENKIILSAISTPATVLPNTNAPQILIQAEIFQIAAMDFSNVLLNVVLDSKFLRKAGHLNQQCRLTSQQFAEVQATMRQAGFKPLMRPRILTSVGTPARLYFGDAARGTELNCTPTVNGAKIQLNMTGKVDAPAKSSSDFGTWTLVENRGGVLFRSRNADSSSVSNYVILLGVETVTNPPARFQQRLQGVIKRADGAQTNFIATVAGRRAIVSKLGQIRLDHIAYDHLPLGEVIRQLSAEIKKRDPEKQGVNFITQLSVAEQPAGLPAVDPLTGLPLATKAAPAGNGEINSALINIANLTDVRALDVLDAIVLTADQPLKYSIQDYAVVFSAKEAEAPRLFARIFQVDPTTLRAGVKSIRSQQFGSNTNRGADVSWLSPAEAAKEFFAGLGVDWKSPPGKSVFYNDRLGKLYVRATEADLDATERALSALDAARPQIHIKARFIEVPKTGLGNLYFGEIITNGAVSLSVSTWQSVGKITNVANMSSGWMCVLPADKLNKAINTLASRTDVEELAEPEVTTASGRQTQMKATQIRNLDPNYGKGLTGSGYASAAPPPEFLETGPALELVPSVLSDGFAINLEAKLVVTELIGSIPSTNTSFSNATDNARAGVPKFIVKLRGWQAAANLILQDGQTVIIGGLPVAKSDDTRKPLEKPKTDRETVVLITATIVDPAGNRVHKDDELPFAQKGAPPQPSPPKPK